MPWKNRFGGAVLSRHVSHSAPRSEKCCASKKNEPRPPPAQSLGFWSSKPTWHRASLNTLRCLVGCTTGDFSAMWLLQTHYPELGMPTIMGVSMAAGITTSMILETVLLRLGRDGLSWPAAAKTAAGMSLISMITMELAENVVDYSLTGGTVAFDSPAFWLAAAVSMGAGFLAPLPYNYHRLRKMLTPRRTHNISVGNLLLALQGLNPGQNFIYQSEHKGNRFVLFKFRKEDGSCIALRIQHQWPMLVHPDILQNIVRREVYVLKKLELIQFRWAPKCLAFDLGFNNPPQHPFLVVTWAEGQPAAWTEDYPTIDLQDETAKQYYTRIIHDRLMSAPRGPPGAGNIPTQEDYWNQLAHLDSVFGVAVDENTYAVAHNNLTADNIIVDQDYNIECIIGWSCGGVYPLCQAAILPRFLAPPVSFRNRTKALFLAQKLVGDKLQYRHQLNLYNLTMTAATAAIRLWQNGHDADFRALYLLSMKHRDINAWLAHHNWKPPHCQNYCDVPVPPPGGLPTRDGLGGTVWPR
ncbi:hypothetical protein NLG97_g8713 [Lecanicillium saksenae]|uniref:Uncharacterized protein n=1 Tax=Lecanicillium saksenae TaxID=468837 RepID=A0ACC1QLF6_9HYPO|nr:hypothetical protein NLG97_g8713 [Lecanicillium saksenae]